MTLCHAQDKFSLLLSRNSFRKIKLNTRRSEIRQKTLSRFHFNIVTFVGILKGVIPSCGSTHSTTNRFFLCQPNERLVVKTRSRIQLLKKIILIVPTLGRNFTKLNGPRKRIRYDRIRARANQCKGFIIHLTSARKLNASRTTASQKTRAKVELRIPLIRILKRVIPTGLITNAALNCFAFRQPYNCLII